jgi:hypothetical protein
MALSSPVAALMDTEHRWLYVVCDDGSVWRRTLDDVVSGWHPVPPVPQTREAQERQLDRMY